jgi:hypothetical protein
MCRQFIGYAKMGGRGDLEVNNERYIPEKV